MKRSFWVAAGVIIVAIIAATYYYTRDVKAEAPAFTTAEVLRGDVTSTVEAIGTLEAVTTVQVGSQVSGTISALHADFNSKVRQGQVIAELDSSLLQTQVEQARATVARLQADFERAKVQAADGTLKLTRAHELFDRQLIPKTDLETAESTARSADAAVNGAEAEIVQAKASLNQAQVNLSHTIIKAPIDGVVIARNVDVGQTVASSLQAPTLFILARDLTEMQVNASVDESDIGEIAPKQDVRFRVDAYPNETFTGKVRQVRLQPVVQQNVVSYVTVIDVPNRELKLKPGMCQKIPVLALEDKLPPRPPRQDALSIQELAVTVGILQQIIGRAGFNLFLRLCRLLGLDLRDLHLKGLQPRVEVLGGRRNRLICRQRR